MATDLLRFLFHLRLGHAARERATELTRRSVLHNRHALVLKPIAIIPTEAAVDALPPAARAPPGDMK
jgi:hypothetical protein